MGKIFTYSCNKCDYSVQTSGRQDYGMFAVTDTYICNSCREIVDVTVGFYGEIFTKEEISIRKLSKEIDFDLSFYSCPDCGSEYDLFKWDTQKRPCPKCNGEMEKDTSGETIFWD